MRPLARSALGVLAFCAGCGRSCAAPKPEADDPGPGLDAAPSSGEAPPRCEFDHRIDLGGDMELGRMTLAGSRALVGARRGGRAGVAEIDLHQLDAQARFVDVAPAAEEAPPPLPIALGDQVFTLGYESGPSKRLRLVLRALASPSAAPVELPPEAPDDSLAFDAMAAAGDAVLVAWDAPDVHGSAVFVAVLVPGAKPKQPVRVSPEDMDADTPRLARGPAGPVALFAAHRPLPPSDAAPLPEGPGEDPEHVWVAMQPLDATGHPDGPVEDVTPESGSVAGYEAVPLSSGSTDFDVVARDAVELGVGQGGKVVLGLVRGGHASPPSVAAEHVGRGVPSLVPGSPGLLLFTDPSDRGRSCAVGGSGAFEPALDGAHPLGLVPAAEPGWLRVLASTAAAGSEPASLRILRCKIGGPP